MFMSTIPVLSTDLTTEAPGQFGKAAEDKLLNHLENVLESGIHLVFPLPYLPTHTSLQAVFHWAIGPEWNHKESL